MVGTSPPIQVFNHGNMRRDFTYIDDAVEGVIRAAGLPPARKDTEAGPLDSTVPYRIYNIGNHQPVELNRLIEILEKSLGRKAERENLPLQPGDVPVTFADMDALARDTGFRPTTPIEEGVERFVAWYREYQGL